MQYKNCFDVHLNVTYTLWTPKPGGRKVPLSNFNETIGEHIRRTHEMNNPTAFSKSSNWWPEVEHDIWHCWVWHGHHFTIVPCFVFLLQMALTKKDFDDLKPLVDRTVSKFLGFSEPTLVTAAVSCLEKGYDKRKTVGQQCGIYHLFDKHCALFHTLNL